MWRPLTNGLSALCRSTYTRPSSRRSFAAVAELKKTVLYDTHVADGARMMPYWGWSMPLQYKDGIIESTRHCRKHASLFDISHMCGFTLKGMDAVPFLETLVVSDLAGLEDMTSTLSAFTTAEGGIIEDTIITKVASDELYVVDAVDIGKHVEAYKAKGGDVNMTVHDDRCLLALQGPQAHQVLQALTSEDLTRLHFTSFKKFTAAGLPLWVGRTGYTGEDGFEISVPSEYALALVEMLLQDKRVRMAGLGARDCLRLEAGLCLSGNDLHEGITSIEAGLAWTVSKRRRETYNFPGGHVIKQQLAEGVTKTRVGLIMSSGPPVRQHTQIRTLDGEVVGEVTSGTFSPCLRRNIAMGYVAKGHEKAGTKLTVDVRGKAYEAEVVKTPFVPTNYYRGEPSPYKPRRALCMQAPVSDRQAVAAA